MKKMNDPSGAIIIALYIGSWLFVLAFFAFMPHKVNFDKNQDQDSAIALNTIPQAEPTERLVTSARVKSVYDGDTIVVELTKEVRIRMLDCWAAEIRTKDDDEKKKGLEAKAFLESMLKSGDIVLVDIPMSNKLQDSLTLGRVLAYIYKDVDKDGIKDNISKKMVESGHAYENKNN